MESFYDLNITAEDLSDILSSSFYGISYWADSITPLNKIDRFENIESAFASGIPMLIHDFESDYYYRITAEDMKRGIKKWYENGYDKYNAINNGSINTCQVDSVAADIIIQLTLFDDVVYS